MSRSLHMRRPPLTVGREAAGYARGGYGTYDDEGYEEEYADGGDMGGAAYGTQEASSASHEPSGVDRQAKRLAELQARFAELRAKAENEAMEELLSSRGSEAARGEAWEPRRSEQRDTDSTRGHEAGGRAVSRAGAADPHQRPADPRQSRSGKAPKPRGSGGTSNVAWLEKIKREVDGAQDAADTEAWYDETVNSERASQSTRSTERSTMRSRPTERSYGGRSSGGQSSRRAASPARAASRQHVIRHHLAHSDPDHVAPSREEVVKLAARARTQQAFGDVDFAETRSTHKLLQGQLAQNRQERALQESRRKQHSSVRRPVSAPRARSNGRRVRSVHFEAASPPRGSARDDTRGRFGVESTGREPPLRNASRISSTRRPASAPRERRTKQPATKQPWRSAAPAKGKEDPFELAGRFASHKEKVPRTEFSKTETAGAMETEVSAEISADLSARVEQCGVDLAKLATLKQKLKAHSYGQTGQNPNKLFKHFDRDNTGRLEFNEFKAAVRKVGHMTYTQISDKELNKLFKGLDRDDSGDVGIDELTAFVWGKANGAETRTVTTVPKPTVPEAAPPRLQGQGQNASSWERAPSPSADSLHERTEAEDALQTAAALSQAAITPGSPAQEPMSAAEWRRQQFEDAAASGYVPSHSHNAWSTSLPQYEPWSHDINAPEENADTTFKEATGYAQHTVMYAAGDDCDDLRERTTYIDSSGVPIGPMRVAASRPAAEPEPESGGQERSSDRHQRFVKSGVGGRQGVSMRQMRRHAGVDSKGRPPAKKVPVQETVMSEAACGTAGGQPQMANPPPRQAKPRIDRISTRSVRLRWTTDHGEGQGKLNFFLYRSSYRNTGERVPDSVVEITCGQEETWIDAFASKDQLAYQYGYVLIACNERGEFSPPSTVAMVRPKKDDRRTPRSPKRDSWRGH